VILTRTSVILKIIMRFSDAEWDLNMHENGFDTHEYDWFTQSVIYSRKMCFLHAVCDFDMRGYEFDTHEYDSYT
jgi:hypothetical protein